MIKSENASLPLLKRVDELVIQQHSCLRSSDEVYFLQEYTAGKYADHSETNKLILNYKKEPKWKDHPSWSYKESAIKRVADFFRLSILQTSGFPERSNQALHVPIPPHAIKGHPDHDDRNLRMLHSFLPQGKIHELLLQKKTRAPLHKSNKRNFQALEDNYFLNSPNPDLQFDEVWLYDDILRDGTHFRAASNVISLIYPGIRIVGFFVARSVQHSPLPFDFSNQPPY